MHMMHPYQFNIGANNYVITLYADCALARSLHLFMDNFRLIIHLVVNFYKAENVIHMLRALSCTAENVMRC